MEITIEERKKQSTNIILYLNSKSKDMGGAERVEFIYNNAVDDVVSAIEIYSKKNPQFRGAFDALKKEIESWMPLV